MTETSKPRHGGARSHAGTNAFTRPAVLVGFLLLILAALLLAHQVIRQAQGAEPEKPAAAKPDQKPADQGKKKDPYAWQSLFDGKTLKGWKAPKFGGEGKVEVKDGQIVLNMGDTMTGITYTGKVPRTNYEIELEAMRLDGVDFFATTTFPVGEESCSLVVGGWGGTVVGLSCVDYYDASDNFTTTFHSFEDKKWYKIRIRVTSAKIEAWIDDEQVVNQEREGHKFTIRDEVDLCQPLGVSTWCTAGAIRNIRMRELSPADIEAATEQEQ